jgi:hypothetical protein
LWDDLETPRLQAPNAPYDAAKQFENMTLTTLSIILVQKNNTVIDNNDHYNKEIFYIH